MSDDPDFEYLIIDSTIVRAHQHAAGAKKGPENQALGRSRGGLSTNGRSRIGVPVRFTLTAGQKWRCAASRSLDRRTLRRRVSWPTPPMTPTISAKPSPPRSGCCHTQQSITLTQLSTRQAPPCPRHLVECCFSKLKQFRRVATRSDILQVLFFPASLWRCSERGHACPFFASGRSSRRCSSWSAF